MRECVGFISSHVKDSLTYFEYLTASAFLYFYQEKVDIAVLEVGMGGRLDATNVVKPILSVISNIHRDHEEYLGHHLKHIACEKAAIIKENNICITAVSQKDIIKILDDTCRRKRANLLRLGKDIHVRLKGNGQFSYQGLGLKIANLYSSLSGVHQVKNAALALAAAELITAKGIKVTAEAMITGVASATWEGRLEILQKMPTVIVDGAHNLSAVAVLCDELRQRNSLTRNILIFGVLRDKNYRLMLKKLLPFFQHIIFTRPKTERAVDVDLLMNMAQEYGHFSEAIENCREALKRALSLAGNKDLICATGSLYLVGEIKKIYAEGVSLKNRE
jgi:dihydrofolate synthase/folylpolyglutamate synthase